MIEQFGNLEQFEQKDKPIDDDIHRNFRPGAEKLDIPESSNKATDQTREWIEIGYQNVPVNKIEVSDSSVHGESDFGKVSYNEMKEGMGILEEEVRPLVEKQNIDREYFERLDRIDPLDGDIIRTKIFNSFYGKKISSVKLEKINDHYKVLNGYHRIYVAKDLNMETVPALVKVRS